MFDNAIEAFAKAKLAAVEAKLKAIDVDHNGLPDLAEAEKLITAGITGLTALEAKLSPTKIALALNMLFPGDFTPAEITTAEADAASLIAGFEKLEGLAKVAATVL